MASNTSSVPIDSNRVHGDATAPSSQVLALMDVRTNLLSMTGTLVLRGLQGLWNTDLMSNLLL